ncbi:pyruvate/2-oxoglutarate dehydrogenase complex, dihydrolipoamide dehydrogenase component [Burkholderia sp. Ch1-1]|uniref:Pyruvate/2-oxoglutarate dehydrogenase complex, dihydrolipoamide dehydrogenase component n=1 Tax=Paraburkholderia dioscoreae TaxID=2604047 RepID=A0A5Q4Z7A0_9BURK|nr:MULTISPECIES: FAD-containing oxidoreductase [Paraburkholderia]EIF30515.1 pyruvate/2-oxoglutarate dehydrogenase complex, dihydrolipoamide dehydrogenase component [Burkholderia sp. Ch1-1]MDR8395062.1 FAD-containing oxidoreductase [Paraburkholderia sp. USG1]VVD29385.1 Pyruvate/2-oxoglutarate dehydrogenase complex, dihydrolipoamide dehydrogenase component [Paraburkholderia dioscoreae]
MPQHFNAVVIGTGQGGSPLAVRLGQSGRKTAVIERGAFGGTCVNVGCTPTKSYVASARAAHVARHCAELGVQVSGAISVDLAAVKARKDSIIGQSRDGVEKWLRGAKNVSVFNGHARFTGAHTLSISGPDGKLLEEISADEIFINTGTRAVVPPLEGLGRIRYYTNSNLLELTELPDHLVIVGASYIALEFAQIFRRFGSRVTVLVRGERVLTREDADFAESVHKVLAREGVEFRFGVQPSRVEPHPHHPNEVCIGFEQNIPALEASHLLFATGRAPNTDDLGLAAAGITTDRHGTIPVDGQLRTNVPGVWAIGDVNGRGAFTHTSYDDFQIVAANLLDGGARSVDTRIMAYAVFVDPPLARVGASEAEVRKSGRAALIATMPMSRVGRARERGETDGFMKVMVDSESRQILGAAIHGIEGDEAIHTFIDIMAAGAPYPTLQYAMHIHPTISELVPTLLDGLKPMK